MIQVTAGFCYEFLVVYATIAIGYTQSIMLLFPENSPKQQKPPKEPMPSSAMFYAALLFSAVYIAFGLAAALHDKSWFAVMDKILPIITLWTQAPQVPSGLGGKKKNNNSDNDPQP